MSQSKGMSFVEAVTNTAVTAVGLVIAYFAQIWFFAWAGIAITDSQNLALVLFMTVVSVARSYMLRRLFNKQPEAVRPLVVEVVPVKICGDHCREMNRVRFDEESARTHLLGIRHVNVARHIDRKTSSQSRVRYAILASVHQRSLVWSES